MNRLGRSSTLLLFWLILEVPTSAFAASPLTTGGGYAIQPVYQRSSGWWAAGLSGTLTRQSAVTTSWFLYPGACVQRALGTWSAKLSPVSDSLQPTAGFVNSSGYTDNQPDLAGSNNTIAYTRSDRSFAEILWHVADSSTPSSQRPPILSGSRSLWCGKYDPAWAVRVGYPDVTYQILYIDTGAHTTPYTLTLLMSSSCEVIYDHFHLLGGGADSTDPLQNRRDLMDGIIQTGTGGPSGDSELLVTWSGVIQSPQSLNTTGGPVTVTGANSGSPSSVSVSITIAADHRALYFVFQSDDHFSSEDGLWPHGQGHVLDTIAASDNGSLYSDQVAAGGFDPYNGNVITGTHGSGGFISCRVSPGVGELWQLAPGTENVTADLCSPQKAFGSDLFFEGGDPFTNQSINKQSNSVVSCTFAIPAGTGSVSTLWSEYLDLPRGSGYVQFAEYRIFKGGGWSSWKGTSAANERHAGANQSWGTNGDELADAAQADSIQLRWNLQCVPNYAADKANCSSIIANALLYDDLRLQITTGIPAPFFGIFVGSVAQTTFVDGTMHGTNCSTTPCWPGIRGTDLAAGVRIDDNFNSPTGDSITVHCVSALRQNGMGINWNQGFDKTVNSGLTIAHTNGAYNPLLDQPRMIYRLFDPLTRTWSPFDSTALDADAVSAGASDTTVIKNSFRVDWPPRDKAGLNLPGGFSINGVTAYSSLAFLPRGARLQYYFKTVDINGGRTYQFSSDGAAFEVTDLPTLPGGSTRAPDIIEFQVLPGAYPPGPAGSLLAGRTNTPLLNLDGTYTFWSASFDPVLQALRGLGVRADRYRLLQAYETGGNLGGHETPGQRIARLGNYFPNYTEYAIVDSLATWYRIMIESSHERTFTVLEEQDATLLEQWWRRETGSNQGDRCVLLTGDDQFSLMHSSPGIINTLQVSLAQNVFGVSSATSAWSGTTGNSYPTIDDRFAAASAGPNLAAPSTFTYPVDGGCPRPNRFDALTKVGDVDAQNAVFYPNAQVAGIARSRELDIVADKDRNKALGYGYSIQFLRDPAYGVANANYARSGVENRMRVLYKFLTSCRGARTAVPADTGKCWPCPSPGTTLALMQGEWAGQSAGFQTGTWGPLYPIQAGGLASTVEEPAPGSPPHVNALLQNRPNPFNPETVIPFSIANQGRVVIRVFDIMGRSVRTLVDRVETAGIHVVRWNGKTDGGARAASGVYFYRITYPNGEDSAKKLMIVR
jgi:hypothetical protein